RDADVIEAFRCDPVDILGSEADAPGVGPGGFPAIAQVHAAADVAHGTVGRGVLAEAFRFDKSGWRGGPGMESQGDWLACFHLKDLAERAVVPGGGDPLAFECRCTCQRPFFQADRATVAGGPAIGYRAIAD